MVSTTTEFKSAITASVRKIDAKVELYNGSTLVDTYTQADRIKSIEIQRVADNNVFFGQVVCQRCNIHLIDKNRELSITTANKLAVSFGINEEYPAAFPFFFVSEVHRDENTNELSITAYDAIYSTDKYLLSELTIPTGQNLRQQLSPIVSKLGLTTSSISTAAISSFEALTFDGANFDGTETLKTVLQHIAEATQTLCYIGGNNRLKFVRLKVNGASVHTINKDDYITLSNSDNRKLTTIVSVTELGDNVSATTGAIGSTQYIRENAFLVLRDDIGTLLDDAIVGIGDLTIAKFNCTWRGNPAFELGDKIRIKAKNNQYFYTFVLDDVITYNGAYSHKTAWNYDDNTEEVTANPSTIGAQLKKTSAKVDKVNGKIDLEVSASETRTNQQLEQITTNYTSQIEQTAQGINSTVSALSDKVDLADRTIEGAQEQIQELNNSFTSLSQTATAIQGTISNLQTSIDGKETITNTTATLDTNGLTVGKSNSSTKTTISDDGMTVKYNSQNMLIADSQGVIAKDLTAKNYLIIDGLIRFQKYGTNRVGCYWIGG